MIESIILQIIRYLYYTNYLKLYYQLLTIQTGEGQQEKCLFP